MGAAVALGDVICERQHILVVAVVPPHRDFNTDVVLDAVDIDRVRDHRGFGAVEILHKFPHAAFVDHQLFQRLSGSFVAQADANA